MTIRREVDWGVVYPHSPEYVHPFDDREYAEAHVRSTYSILVKREWTEVEPAPESGPHDSGAH